MTDALFLRRSPAIRTTAFEQEIIPTGGLGTEPLVIEVWLQWQIK